MVKNKSCHNPSIFSIYKKPEALIISNFGKDINVMEIHNFRSHNFLKYWRKNFKNISEGVSL